MHFLVICKESYGIESFLFLLFVKLGPVHITIVLSVFSEFKIRISVLEVTHVFSPLWVLNLLSHKVECVPSRV